MAVADPTDRNQVERALAATYDVRSDATAWEVVEQYRAVSEYTNGHPDAGPGSVASALELPRSRIRNWITGDARPHPVRGIETAERYGWLDLEWAARPLGDLAVAVAWIFAAGSINRQWVPQFTVSPDSEAIVQTLLDRLGPGATTHHDQDDSRTTELRPAADATVLGRLLHALGAPQGAKHADRDLSLPPWLGDAPPVIRVAIARAFIANRGTVRDDSSYALHLKSERKPAFYDALETFLWDVAGGGVVRGGPDMLYLTDGAADQLYQWPCLTGLSD